jgi:hypothetical protein
MRVYLLELERLDEVVAKQANIQKPFSSSVVCAFLASASSSDRNTANT